MRDSYLSISRVGQSQSERKAFDTATSPLPQQQVSQGDRFLHADNYDLQ